MSNFFMLLIQRFVFLSFTLYCSLLQSEQWRTYPLSTPSPSLQLTRQATPHHQHHKKLPSSSRQPKTPPLFIVVSNNNHYICNSRTNSTFNQTRSVQAVTESPSAAPARRPPPPFRVRLFTRLRLRFK
jgi:hypothetical protein